MKITALIMAGGKGERFWPRSRVKLPKQLISLNGEKTMIQLTVERLNKLIEKQDIFIITNSDYSELIAKQLPDIPADNIIVEPMGKNTAACIGLSAIRIQEKYDDCIMLVLPSDHIIKDEEEFIKIIKGACNVAEENQNICTIGIVPSYPETGYGYIKLDRNADAYENLNVYKVDKFVEKPNLETAKSYIESKMYFWNSGMFAWKHSTIVNLINEHMPKLADALHNMKLAIGNDNEYKVINDEYLNLDSISIDYGIMEKAKEIFVIPGDFGWDDVGSWNALERVFEPDEFGNIIKGNVITIGTQNCIIQSESKDKVMAAIGIEDIVIVDTKDAVLICNKNNTQDIRKIINTLKASNMEEYL